MSGRARARTATVATTVGALAATAVGTAVRDLGAGVLLGAAVLTVVGVARRCWGESAPLVWPALADEPPGQVGHPRIARLSVEFERAERESAVRRELGERVSAAVSAGRPANPRPARTMSDLHRLLDEAEPDRD